MLEFRLLGTLEVLNDDALTRVSRGMRQTILVTLLASQGKALNTEEGIDILWPRRRPKTARDAFYVHMGKLRDELTSTGATDPVKKADDGYRMVPGTYRLDVARFDSLVAQGRRAAAHGRLKTAWSAYHRALSLVRGDEPLRGIEHLAIVADLVRELTEKIFAARENWCEVGLDLGRYREALPLLRRLYQEDSLRERAQELLLIAEYWDGGQPRGLRVFDTIRRTVIDETGLDPSDRLRWLQQQIYLHKPAHSLLRPVNEAF